jgi:hypothetical protein
MTLEQRDNMIRDQGGICAVPGCGKKLDLNVKRSVHVDHCHVSGKVRGVVCAPCNMTIGYIERAARLRLDVSQYLRQAGNPAPISNNPFAGLFDHSS